jgi:hypothetical protein
VVITDSANASSIGKIFTILFFNYFSSLAFTTYTLVAEETLVSQLHGVLLLVMIQFQPHQGFNHLLLIQKSQLHQEIIQLPLSQIYKSLPLSLRSFRLPFGKLGMM